jgi:hypothetical protein
VTGGYSTLVFLCQNLQSAFRSVPFRSVICMLLLPEEKKGNILERPKAMDWGEK